MRELTCFFFSDYCSFVMKIRFAFPSRLRKKNFISSLSLLLVICAFLLLFLKFTVKYSITIETYGSTAGYNDIELLHRYNIDCNAIYEMEPAELGKSLVIRKQVVVEEQDKSLVNLISNCPRYLRSRGYGDVQVSEEEQAFPLAYSLVVHKSASMVEKILRAVYTPNNIYCIHYDLKSSELFRESMEGLARCLPNVFIASKLEAVTYASISRLNADLNCLSDLIGSKVKWRYVINLCGQDFPLRSNIELVADLKKLRGGNMMETSRPSEYKKQRFSFHHELQNASFEYHRLPVKTNKAKGPPPHGIQMFIGSAYFADITDLMSKTRLVKWNYLEGPLYPSCTGKHVRSVCIYGAGELRWLLNYGSWFANKVDAKVDPVLIQCLEDTLQEKQRLLVKAMKSQQKIPSSVLAVDVILQ
ncbi:unnamed protein product [Oncorhynchus mykiss]|uniref:Beta-1,3-galactosyl-O-glycosyl-glycoprotein beta-1,6-N-acetylglucosaminyltransferase 4 n=1 Tax=Oncorhynchus mykiss TaxID=8022 RepID=A0A060XEL9_ONCMY|nr:unnamed protein product [Oncorhynchus mykiss]